MQSILHYVSLDGLGGVELQFADFIAATQRRDMGQHHFVACGKNTHPELARRAEFMTACAGREKYAGPVKLPRWPEFLRMARQARFVRTHRPDVVVIWNRMRDSLNTLAAAGADKCFYWERGSAWFPGETASKHEFLQAVPAALCNSHASRRMLQLRWNYEGAIRVCHNALRTSLVPVESPARAYPETRPIRLGVVARLVPLKGVALAIHTLHELRSAGTNAILNIAGDGPERARLESLVAKLGLSEQVKFRGLVTDMASFYAQIDCLLHPALREPFGQITLEAAAYGCPSVVAAVDGLPETIAEGKTGYAVPLDLPVQEYEALGGGHQDIPPFVYDPTQDQLTEPRLANPDSLADAVLKVFETPEKFESMSVAAIAHVREKFNFENHVTAALSAMQEFSETGTLQT